MDLRRRLQAKRMDRRLLVKKMQAKRTEFYTITMALANVRDTQRVESTGRTVTGNSRYFAQDA
jgi:hypothetical protein